MIRKYLVKSDFGDVLVTVNPECQNALEQDLLRLDIPTPENSAELNSEVPLRAFGAKMVDIIEIVGTGSFKASPVMMQMLKQEKATSELKRIERFAKEHSKSSKDPTNEN
ncbi:MAG: hypothetical protein R2880_17525 [Deinococcales bacterium]